MKKLLTSTALIGASVLAFSANAKGLDVTIGGELDFQIAYGVQDSLYEVGAFTREMTFANDTEIHVNVSGESDNGLRYGATIELEADTSADARGEGGNADKTYLWVEGGFGRVEMGNNAGAEAAMAINAATIARGTGGIDGDHELYINTTGIFGTSTFLVTPDLPSAARGGATEDATKLTYYSPNFSGASFGFSFTPDTGNGGTAAGFTTNNDIADFENVVSAALAYSGEAGGIGFEASIEGEIGEAESAFTEDLEAWQVGLSLTHEDTGISLAGSYGDHGESGMLINSGSDASFWTVGASYTREDCECGASFTYIESEFGGNDFSNAVVSLDYVAAPGFTPYMEVSFFEAEEAGVPNSNDGSVVLTGAVLNF